MKLIYLAGKRGKEMPLLTHLEREGQLSFLHIRIHFRSMGAGAPLLLFLRLFHTVRRFRPDILLLEDAGFFSLPARWIGRIRGIPYVVRIKGDPWMKFEERTLPLPLKEKLIKLLNYYSGLRVMTDARMILPISRNMERIVLDHMNRVRTAVVPIPWSETPSEPEPSPERPRSGAGESKSERGGELPATAEPIRTEYLLTVTNFNFWKKVEPLLEAVRSLAPLLREIRTPWIILGGGFFWKRFCEQVENEIGSGIVSLPGVRDPAPFYRSALVHLFISGSDGLPNVFLEGSLKRLPFIIQRDSPIREFIRHDENGLILDFADLKEVKKTLLRLKEDGSFRERLGRGAEKYVKEKFSVEAISPLLLEALHEALRLPPESPQREETEQRREPPV